MGIQARLYGRRYPWRRWFRKGGFTLVRHHDYNGMSHSMSQQVRNAAAKWGVKVSISVSSDSIAVTVLTPLAGAEEKDTGGARTGKGRSRADSGGLGGRARAGPARPRPAGAGGQP